MTPQAYGVHLAQQMPPLTDTEVEAAARLFLVLSREQEAA